MERNELKPCPFCGGKARLITLNSVKYFEHTEYSGEIHCINCDATIDKEWIISSNPLRLCGNNESVYDLWNKRTPFEIRNEWISIEERMPEAYTRVLGYIKHLDEIRCYDITEGRWWTDEGWNTAKGFGITHWMPLPEPPKVKGGVG